MACGYFYCLRSLKWPFPPRIHSVTLCHGETVAFLCLSQGGGEGSEGACLKHDVSCPRGTTAAGWTQARAPPPVWLEVELWNLECRLLPRWLLVCLVSRTLHCQADPLAAGGAVVSTLAPKGKRESSWWGRGALAWIASTLWGLIAQLEERKDAEQFRNWSLGFPEPRTLYTWKIYRDC